MKKVDNTGIVSPLILIGMAVVVVFLLVAYSGPFTSQILGTLFPKNASFAATPGVGFVDSNNQPITQITTPMARVMLTSPWSVKGQASLLESGFQLISTANAQTAASVTLNLSASGNAIEDGSVVSNNQSTIWIGNGASTTKSLTGLRYAGVNIPKGAKISSAKLQVYSTQSPWISVKTDIFGENKGNSGGFSNSSRPSQRVLTSAKVAYASDIKWNQKTWYELADVSSVVQEIVNRSDWNSGNNMSLILKGTGTPYGRKYVAGKGINGAKLTIIYSGGTGGQASAAPSSAPSVAPSPVVSPSPSVTPYVVSAKIAEDSGFTKNVKDINPFVSNPTYLDYVFADTSYGTKTVYAKFVSSTGEEQAFSASIQYAEAQASAMPSHDSTGGAGTNSYAMGLWTPNPTYDTCTKEQHDAYKVQGPDGKWYPTWHPALGPGGCKFGHEHGRDPSKSMVWQQAKEYFYYDANKNGVMDPDEEAVTGLPFGYVNEQYDTYLASLSQSGMRHEDHVGHKVEWANDETDLATHNRSTTKNTGVWIQNNSTLADTGVRCYFMAKPHQGVSSKDAFTNNIHEVFYFQDCRLESNPALNTKISVAMMEGFGNPGGFTNFMPMCGIERRSDPQDRICPLGVDAGGKCVLDSVNKNYPGGDGDREIITRECIEKGFLVPSGSWSGNMYEAWPASLQVVDLQGRNLVTGINLLFDVEDANRYYYPEALKQQRGYNNPDAGTNVGFTMDLCYDKSLESAGRIYRGGPCDWGTNYGQIKDVKWNDPRSAFKGLHRGMYFQAAALDNAGNPEVVYTDPFGKKAQVSPFPGSVKQVMSAKDVNYSSLIGQSTDPRVNDRTHDSGGGTVHAPN